MLGTFFSFSKLNNESNYYIPTKIGYFTFLNCCPDLPVNYFNEDLAYNKVSVHEYAELVQKLKEACDDFFILKVFWFLRWLTRFVLLYTVFQLLFTDSIVQEQFSFQPTYAVISVIITKFLLFLLSRKIVNAYRRKMHSVLNKENHDKWVAKNLFWRVLPECRYIHLVLNYESFSLQNANISMNETFSHL
jgi:hypothetical protein